MVSKKSVGRNATLNVIKTLFAIVFPLITFPYVSRILQVNNLGKINYATSIVSYYALFAALGISTYAIREGARIREDKTKIEVFVGEVFSINVITTAIAYTIFFISLVFIGKFHNYRWLLLIESLTILFTTLGVDWINVIYEEYAYITIRSLIVQIVSLVMIFTLVHDVNDYYIYACITVFGHGLVSLLNIVHIKKYCKIKITFKLSIWRHLKPILVLFSNNIAVSIYLNSDMTMLGWIAGDYYTGLYAVAVKVYSIVKQVIAALYNVVVARLSFYYASNQIDEFCHLLNSVINSVIVISIPSTIGLFCTSNDIIDVLSGPQYKGAGNALQILSLAIFFAIMGGLFSNCVNLPLKREKYNLAATCISAIENICLNLAFISSLKQVGTALTTLLAEITVSLVIIIGLKRYYCLFDFKAIGTNLFKSLLASSSIVFWVYFLKSIIGLSGGLYLIIICTAGAASYLALNIMLKNRWVKEVAFSIIKKGY